MKRKLFLITTGLVATGSLALVSGCSSFMQGFKEGWNQSKYTEAMKTTFMVNCTPEAEKKCLGRRSQNLLRVCLRASVFHHSGG